MQARHPITPGSLELVLSASNMEVYVYAKYVNVKQTHETLNKTNHFQTSY